MHVKETLKFKEHTDFCNIAHINAKKTFVFSEWLLMSLKKIFFTSVCNNIFLINTRENMSEILKYDKITK